MTTFVTGWPIHMRLRYCPQKHTVNVDSTLLSLVTNNGSNEAAETYALGATPACSISIHEYTQTKMKTCYHFLLHTGTKYCVNAHKDLLAYRY